MDESDTRPREISPGVKNVATGRGTGREPVATRMTGSDPLMSDAIEVGIAPEDTHEPSDFHREGKLMTEPRCDLGRLVATPGALEALGNAGQIPDEFVRRHVAGDWGDVDDHDRRE